MQRRKAQIEESVARYLHQLDSADRQDPSLSRTAKIDHLNDKVTKLKAEMERLAALEEEMLARPEQQISETDPDARSMATSGRGSGMVGYNVQIAVDTANHLVVSHEVRNEGTDKSLLFHMGARAKAALGVDKMEVVADRGYHKSEEILDCANAGITVTLPKPQTSNNRLKGLFVKPDSVYLADEDV